MNLDDLPLQKEEKKETREIEINLLDSHAIKLASSLPKIFQAHFSSSTTAASPKMSPRKAVPILLQLNISFSKVFVSSTPLWNSPFVSPTTYQSSWAVPHFSFPHVGELCLDNIDSRPLSLSSQKPLVNG